jgi:hypothetical protein
MKTTLAVLVLLVVAAGTVYTQAPAGIPAPENPALPNVPVTAQPPAPTSPLKERSLNQLLDDIQQIRVQKAELEKKEQALIAEVRKLLAQQSDRLNKLGLGAPVQPQSIPETMPPAFSLPTTPGSAAPSPLFPEPAKR